MRNRWGLRCGSGVICVGGTDLIDGFFEYMFIMPTSACYIHLVDKCSRFSVNQGVASLTALYNCSYKPMLKPQCILNCTRTPWLNYHVFSLVLFETQELHMSPPQIAIFTKPAKKY